MTQNYPSTLLYRKQFFYAPKPINLPGTENWKNYPIPYAYGDSGNSYILSTHPDLEVTQVSESGFKITLLGYILDPDRAQDNNQQIISRLCQSAHNPT